MGPSPDGTLILVRGAFSDALIICAELRLGFVHSFMELVVVTFTFSGTYLWVICLGDGGIL